MSFRTRITLCIIAEVLLLALAAASGFIGGIRESDALTDYSMSSQFWMVMKVLFLWMGIPAGLAGIVDEHRKELVRLRASYGDPEDNPDPQSDSDLRG